MPELLPGEASEPVEGQGEDALPGLRLTPVRLGLPLQLLVAGASGLVLSLAFPPAGWWPVVFAAPIPLLWLVREQRPRRGALLGITYGLVSFGLLPVELVGIALLIGAVVLMIVELHAPGFGVWGFAGLACLVLGGWFRV